MKNIYKNDKARALITGILTAFVSVSLAVLGAWNFDQSYFVLKLICFIFFTVLNILHLTFIVAQDSKDKKIAAELERQIKAFENASAGLIATCKSNATRINSLIHYVLSGKSIPEEVRKYKAVCYELCTIIYNVVRNLSNDDCEITYVKLNEAVPGEISTYAFKNQVDQLPKIFNKPRNYLNPEEVE